MYSKIHKSVPEVSSVIKSFKEPFWKAVLERFTNFPNMSCRFCLCALPGYYPREGTEPY